MADSITHIYKSPKRKRTTPIPPTSDLTSTMPPQFSASMSPPPYMPSGSPRTRVAYHFSGLRLDGLEKPFKLDLQRSPSPLPFSNNPKDNEISVRKRLKVLDGHLEREIPDTPPTVANTFGINIGSERQVDPIIVEKAKDVKLYNEVDPVIFGGYAESIKGAGLGQANTSNNQLFDLKSRKKRSGTPPLSKKADGNKAPVVDEERSHLTWHEDEITGHEMDDPDDDGEGINGIGFRPTPAIAHWRAEMRRKQLKDYQRREANEARAHRGEKRRTSVGEKEGFSKNGEEKARRVQFSEADCTNIPQAV